MTRWWQRIGLVQIVVVLVVVGVARAEIGQQPVRAYGDRGIRSAGDVDHTAGGHRAEGLGARALQSVRSLPQRHLGDTAAAALVSGIAFGADERLPSRDRTIMRESGLSHLTAASGQNIALVAWLVIGMAWLAGAPRTFGVAAAMVALPGYVVVAGAGSSIVRAAIIGECALLAWLVGRLHSVWHALWLAACVLVWVQPGVHRELGFQLSFACAAALMAWAQPVTDWAHERGVPRFIGAAVVATSLCSIVTAPILVLQVGQAPAAAALANLVAVPLASIILVLGCVALLVDVVMEPAARPLLEVCAWCANVILWVARRAIHLPGAQVTSRLGVSVALCCAAAPAALHTVRRGRYRSDGGRPPGWWRAPAATAALVCALAVMAGSSSVDRVVAGRRLPRLPSARVPAATARIASFDVGQGDATAVITDHATVLIDTGRPGAGAVAQARALGIRRLSAVVMTHPSLDHDGDAVQVLRALHPRVVLVPTHVGRWPRLEQLRARGVRIEPVCRDAVIALSTAVVLRVVHPRCDGQSVGSTGDRHNDGAVVMVVEVNGRPMALLPADAEGAVTSRLQLPALPYLRVAHHGSDDGDLQVLLDQIRPRIAVISVGASNPYRHPRASTIATLTRAGTAVLRTDRDGAVVADLGPDGIRVWTRSRTPDQRDLQ